MKREHLGEFEELVLLTVAALDGEAYGISIKDDMLSRMERRTSIGALRSVLKRLEQKGYLKSELGEPTAVRGGKRKRYFHVTAAGKRKMERAMEARMRIWSAIPNVSPDFKFS